MVSHTETMAEKNMNKGKNLQKLKMNQLTHTADHNYYPPKKQIVYEIRNLMKKSLTHQYSSNKS